ncbi:MAG: glycosyltransferase family 1 protein [Elusimicrobia bacterium]|nr:glycosyltransferase family 1 protein [Elusimicrobiota bacterium]
MRFKNLLVMTPAGSDVYHHSRALRKCGYGMERLDFIPLIRREGIAAAQRRIEAALEKTRPDLFFATLCGDNFQFPVEFFLRLRRRCPLVFWLYDDESYFDAHSKYYAQAADAVVTTDCFSVPAYEKLGIPAVLCFTSVSKDICAPLSVPKSIDVSFVGDCTKNDRGEYLRHLAENGIKVETFGKGSKNGYIKDTEIAGVFSRSKINLNFSKLDAPGWINRDDPVLNRIRGNKGRPIEIAVAGGFCLTEHYPALPRIFELGRETDFFCDKDSMLSKVRYYLAHDEEREALAERAHLRAMSSYEDERYIPKVMRELELLLENHDVRRCPQPATAYISPGFQRRRANVLFVHLLSALRRFQLRAALEIFASLLGCGPGACALGVLGGLDRAAAIYRTRRTGQ